MLESFIQEERIREIEIPFLRLFLVSQFLEFYIHFLQKDKYLGQTQWLCRRLE